MSVSFKFTVGASFLKGNHRITVPKSQVSYEILENEKLDRDSLTVICPNGERMTGYMYFGKAGYGEYYQIGIHGNKHDSLSNIELGQRLIVEIASIDNTVQVRLKPEN